MDPYAQRLLEKAEQRSRALGICNASKFPFAEKVTEANASSGASATTASQQKQYSQQQPQLQLRSPALSTHVATNSATTHKMQVVEKTPMEASTSTVVSANKVMRQFSALDKENMDLGIEINITTDKNIEVQVEVEEQDITDEDGENSSQFPTSAKENMNQQPLAKLRDTSRNRLQRLGALYSNTNDLSSPIHRTEGKFHADSSENGAFEGSPKKLKQRYGKLVALANTINQWEDDSTTHLVPPPKPDLPSRRLMETGKSKATKPIGETVHHGSDSSSNKTKQLNWDPKVINSLEAQGFQRRDSSQVKISYDYCREDEENNQEKTEVMAKVSEGKLSKKFEPVPEEQIPLIGDKKPPTVKAGLVSGRTAAFESISSSSSNKYPQRPQKDPTELSLRERMQLFEKNKGEALVPKAALGIAPPISKIRQDQAARREDTKGQISASSSGTSLSVKTNADSKVRDKVAALVANATLSENKIKADIQKQRQEDMQILANRFNRQKDIFTREQTEQQHLHQQKAGQSPHQQSQVKATAAALISASNVARPPPPPPPPMLKAATQSELNALAHKRRSPGSVIDEESKRARKSISTGLSQSADHRLYPALSDLESNGSATDNDNCCTTATVSAGRSTGDDEVDDYEEDTGERDENNSYMTSDGDEDSSAGICGGSLGRVVMQAVKKNEHHQHRQHEQQQQHEQPAKRAVKEVHYADKDYYYGAAGGDSSLNSSEVSLGIDDYLDEALDDGDDDDTQESGEDEDINSSRASRGSKGTTTSNSFSFRKASGQPHSCEPISEETDVFQTPTSSVTKMSAPVKSQLSVNREDDNMVTLVHTVSFYRRQQTANSANSTPVRKICREEKVLRSVVEGGGASATMQYNTPRQQHQQDNDSMPYGYSDEDETQSDQEGDDADLVQDKIKRLLDDVCKQQQIIAQISQALNLCAATIEFSGSAESVEGERHLLVATHRRQAALDEVQRLRVEKTLRPMGAPREKGRLTVKEITVPMRQDYIRKLAADTISGHHLVCLLKYNEFVFSTKTVPTLPGLLAVKFPDVLQLNNVYADFRITLEIYGMTAQREILPHEVKYHINLNKKSGVKTPKKKGGENRLVMPPVQSPAGPNVVRTPALVQYGFAIFSLREIQRTSWSLTQVLGVSPLDGVVHMKVNCELSVSVEYKGFLTMFEDISGFGAWHRRWCHLNGTTLNFWKYPDDEKKKTPMGSIDLYSSATHKVAVAPRDICARMHTILLECQRPARDSDVESLIIVPNGHNTIVRHLLSADTKEEREEWCAYLNKALTLLRVWGPPPAAQQQQ